MLQVKYGVFGNVVFENLACLKASTFVTSLEKGVVMQYKCNDSCG